ncbi:MAG: hypothetical protein MJ227_01295 [Bacilli bacterium]|nr:hypothetical protein [Bacilli bacterium]
MKNKSILLIISLLTLPLVGCTNFEFKSLSNNIKNNEISVPKTDYNATFYIDGEVSTVITYNEDNYFEKVVPELPKAEEGYFNYWLPEVDFSKFYDCNYDMMTSLDVRCKKGAFDYVDNSYVSLSDNTFGISNSVKLTSGMLTAHFTKSTAKEDTGIVFGITFDDDEPGSFWENVGVSYYFFYLNQNGAAVLSKVNNGKYKTLVNVAQASSLVDYELTVLINNNDIKCLVNGVECINYTDDNFLTGDEVGFRLHKTGAKIKNLGNTIKSDYEIASGNIIVSGDTITTISDKTLVYKRTDSIYNTTYSCYVKSNVNQQAGFIFGLNSEVSGKFYEDNATYFSYYINENGYVVLEKFVNGNKTIIENSFAIPAYLPSNTYQLSMTIVSNRLRLKIDGTSTYSYTNDVSFAGTLLGFKASLAGAVFSR